MDSANRHKVCRECSASSRSEWRTIQLTPGVVLTASNPSDNGPFSVNGQRAASNYWMVDGVSANIGVGASPSPFALPGNGIAGSLGLLVRYGHADPLAPVSQHNQMDLRGLAGLSGRILSLLGEEAVSEDGLELYGVSRICERRGETRRARKPTPCGCVIGKGCPHFVSEIACLSPRVPAMLT